MQSGVLLVDISETVNMFIKFWESEEWAEGHVLTYYFLMYSSALYAKKPILLPNSILHE